ncbi:2-oxo-4-hydroxy-4-carboxy-5-ureidoimidazoline decarboxylase [Streptomyces sp. C10-9-1]|uniref:2-oxo-4-hydroxy-4-carboxy-5-ureidoimidazoline decarboxylase n=1 Tax=Streptomyces sp. C10-9-1 TaxID=1859285 RepID=UPI003F4A82FE
MSSDTPAALPQRGPAVRPPAAAPAGGATRAIPSARPTAPDPTGGGTSGRAPGAPGLAAFNASPPPRAEALLLGCCGSHRWARRVAAHRPYPDLGALLAACDEAAYDLTPADVHEALALESAAGPAPDAPPAARTALAAAHAAYESRFGHAFVICLDGHRPDEYLDQVLAGIRRRLAHEPDEERSVAADELRALARSRVVRALASAPGKGRPGRPV